MFSAEDVRELVRAATKQIDEDLAQEAALRALDAFRRAGHVEFPRAFLKKVVWDTVRDHWRKKKFESEDIDTIDERFVGFRPQFEDEIDRRRRVALLRRAISRLDASKRRILQLFYEDDLTVSQIARLHRCSISSVKMQLVRARRELARIVRTKATNKAR